MQYKLIEDSIYNAKVHHRALLLLNFIKPSNQKYALPVLFCFLQSSFLVEFMH